MKENKGKRLIDEETMQKGTHSQPRLAIGDKRKTLSMMIDIGSLPSHRGHKKVNYKSFKSRVVKPDLVVPPTPAKPPSVQILDEEQSNLELTPSKTSKSAPMNLLENEDFA